MATGNCPLPWDSLSRKRRRADVVNPPPPPISKLGDDLLIEILIRGLTDLRSACLSKPVCKQWNSLISSPAFNRRFVSHHEEPPLLLPSHDPQSIILSFLPVPAEPRQDFRVLDSCNDLLLCGFGDVYQYQIEEEFRRLYLLCNPFTKQWIALPLAPERPIGYLKLAARLVCEPLVSHNLDLGGDDQVTVCSEYRFRVVCVYQDANSTKLDVFCSESGEWTKEALVLDGHVKKPLINAVSCNGELFWVDSSARNGCDLNPHSIVAFNPFRLDIPPTYIDASPVFGMLRWDLSVFGMLRWDFSVSRGALHLVTFEEEKSTFDRSRFVASVWRLEKDRKSWKKLCEGCVRTSSSKYGLAGIQFHCLHPEKSEIVFYNHISDICVVMSCDLSTGRDLEVITEESPVLPPWRLFQARRASCWPSPIPKYEELRALYGRSYDFLVQSSKPPIPEATLDTLLSWVDL
ncbi:unnamed protein product [Linum trigynum]|uniref:F-box protein At3g26010-like beta-propeller domain-containing protein n=1 Tax=Linum trigynum TaxID=586398 RepID=A0AAV2EKS3_9ROSI